MPTLGKFIISENPHEFTGYFIKPFSYRIARLTQTEDLYWVRTLQIILDADAYIK
jgi:hypothetical protein